ncbi:MAG: TlpA family protein disulfide reductase [Taibaiella sp.]|nr:TlpA family protein disulfide reductase [Taibaiella sp.]
MKYLLVILSLAIANTAFSQPTAKEVLILASKSMSIRNSVTYKADCLYKFYDDDDTLSFSSEVKLLKEVRDTIFGGYIRYDAADTLYKYYDLHGIYIVNTKGKKIDRFDPHKGEYWALTGNIKHELVWTYFLEPERLYKNAHGDAKLSLLADTVLSGIDCYKVRLDYPDDEEYSEHRYTICVTKADKVPVLRYWQIKNQGNYQYSAIHITDYKFNTLKPGDFTADEKHRKYKVDTFVRKPPPPPLAKGTEAPAIKGQHYQQDLSEAEVDFKGKVTLLDFWYMSCYPCIQAIPTIEKLYEAYKDKGLQVFGVNPYDIKRIDRMPNFLENNPIKYPIYMSEVEIPKSYNISGYPTFYLIGKDGKVVFSIVGYNEETTEKELAKAIEEAL